MLLCALAISMVTVVFWEKLPFRGSDGKTRTQRMAEHIKNVNAFQKIDMAAVMEHMSTEDFGHTKFLISSGQEICLAKQAKVIGIFHNGQARAYLGTAMGGIGNHLVHDTLGGKPISLAFCDKMGCARAFNRTIKTEKLYVAGWNGRLKKMMLAIDNRNYTLDSEELPLSELRGVTQCTWEEWKKRHPKSDIYIGAIDKYSE